MAGRDAKLDLGQMCKDVMMHALHCCGEKHPC